MLTWNKDNNSNVRRTASEALRHIAQKQPASVLPILENLKNDSSLYVRKSVANVIRNAGNDEPEFVLTLCSRWGLLHDANTNRIIKDALRKLKTTRPTEVGQVLESLQRTRTE